MKLITILEDITETSMPYNEFILYRLNHFKEEKQVLLLCSSKKTIIPDPRIETYYVGKNLFKIRSLLNKIVKDCNDNNDDYLIHIHQLKSGFISCLAMLFSKYRKRTVYTVHSTFTGYSFHNKFMSVVCSLLSNRVVCVSNYSYDKYPLFIKRLKGNKIFAIQNGVDIERIDQVIADVKKNSNNKVISFVYVARVIPIKNHSFLLDVLEKLPDNVKFIFIGKYSKNDDLFKLIADRHLDNKVELTGLLPRNEVFKRIVNADYYISSSILEGLPVSVLEAMYVGLPAILSNIPQHCEIGVDCTGCKCLELNVDKWVDTINELLNKSENSIKKMGYACKNYVSSNFSLSAMHKKYNDLYKNIMEE